MTILSSWKDKALFTPGPLTTSATIKQAMLRDLGSRDREFINTVKDVRNRLVALGSGSDEYTAVLMQGSGTFGIESVLSSVIPPDGKLLILVPGPNFPTAFQIRSPRRKVPETPATKCKFRRKLSAMSIETVWACNCSFSTRAWCSLKEFCLTTNHARKPHKIKLKASPKTMYRSLMF